MFEIWVRLVRGRVRVWDETHCALEDGGRLTALLSGSAVMMTSVLMAMDVSNGVRVVVVTSVLLAMKESPLSVCTRWWGSRATRSTVWVDHDECDVLGGTVSVLLSDLTDSKDASITEPLATRVDD